MTNLQASGQGSTVAKGGVYVNGSTIGAEVGLSASGDITFHVTA